MTSRSQGGGQLPEKELTSAWRFRSQNAAISPGRTGISLAYLLDVFFEQEATQARDWDTHNICSKVIEPRCRNFQDPSTDLVGCRFADLLDPSYVSTPPTFFFSHTWDGCLREQLEEARSWCQRNGFGDAYVWLDVMVLNQCEQPASKRESIALANMPVMAEGIMSSRYTMLYLDRGAYALTRMWCLFEVWVTLAQRSTSGLQLATGCSPVELTALFGSIDVEKAKCKKDEDKEAINGQITSSGYTLQRINKEVRDALNQMAAIKTREMMATSLGIGAGGPGMAQGTQGNSQGGGMQMISMGLGPGRTGFGPGGGAPGGIGFPGGGMVVTTGFIGMGGRG